MDSAIGGTLRHLRSDPSHPARFRLPRFHLDQPLFPAGEDSLISRPVHLRWPDKPVFISEYGLRADQTKNEDEHFIRFDEMLALVRSHSRNCGLSYWCFNDYASRYPGTGADVYRRWGRVGKFHRPRRRCDHMARLLVHGLDEPTDSRAVHDDVPARQETGKAARRPMWSDRGEQSPGRVRTPTVRARPATPPRPTPALPLSPARKFRPARLRACARSPGPAR